MGKYTTGPQLDFNGREIGDPIKPTKLTVFCRSCSWSGRRQPDNEQRPCRRCGAAVDMDSEAIRIREAW